MNAATKHMLQGAAYTLGAVVLCVGGGYTLGTFQAKAHQEIQTKPELKELRNIQVITSADDGERVQTQANSAPVPITTFCFRKVLHMQVNQGNATWGAAILNPITGKPETCGEQK